MHSVDSNDISFQLAAGAFKEVPQCEPQLLEPMYHVEILPDECNGDVMEIYKPDVR